MFPMQPFGPVKPLSRRPAAIGAAPGFAADDELVNWEEMADDAETESAETVVIFSLSVSTAARAYSLT
jgi:hypothetical protein